MAKKILLIILNILFVSVLSAQKLNVRFVPYGQKGLPVETVFNVYNGQNGTFWLLSDRHLFLYDGNQSKKFSLNLSPENSLSFLVVKSDDDIYAISTESAVYRISLVDSLPNGYSIKKLFIMPDKEYIRNLWFNNSDSIYVQTDSSIRLFTKNGQLIKTIFKVNAGKRFFYRGLSMGEDYYFMGNKQKIYKLSHGIVDSFTTDRQYTSLFKFKDNLYTYDYEAKSMVQFTIDRTFIPLNRIKIPLRQSEISQFLFITEDLFFVTTSSQGAALFNRNGHTLIIDRDSGLPGNKVFYANYKGNMIILATQAGMVYITSPFTLNFDKSTGLYDNFAWSIRKFKGKYYVATSSGVVSLEQKDEFHYRADRLKALGSKAISGLYQQGDQYLWISADEGEGVYRYDGRKVEKVYHLFNAINGSYWNFANQDYSGNLWLVAQAKAIRYNGKSFKNFPLPDEKEKYVLQIKTNYKNNVYAQTEDAIYRLQNDRFERIYSHKNISDFFAKSNDTLLVHFSDGNTVFVAGSQTINLVNKICSRDIFNLDYIPAQKLFFLSDEAGVHLWDCETDSVLHLNSLNGLIYSETNQYSYHFANDGMWIGTPKGLTFVPFKNLKHIKNYKFSAHMETVFYSKKGKKFIPQNDRSLSAIPYNFRNVGFRVIPHYYFEDMPFKMNIQFKPLHGEPIRDLSDYNFNFTYLENGEYQFDLNMYWKFPLYTAFTKHVSFRVKPPFYKTAWFYALDVIVLLLLIYLIAVMRSYRLKKANMRLQELVHERTKALETYKSILESVLKNIKDPIIVFSDKGEYILKNKFPFQAPHGTIDDLAEILPGKHGRLIKEIFEEKKPVSYHTEEPFEFQGEKYYLFFNALLVKEKLRGYSLLMINVTRLLENEILQTRMDTLNQLVATFSHYLNNYLQGIVLHLDLYRLYKSNFKPERAMADISKSVSNIRKMMSNFEKAIENNALILGEYAGIEDSIFKIEDEQDKAD